MKRRSFVKTSIGGSMALATSSFPLSAMTSHFHELAHITILHTNDVHSRIDPFPKTGGRNDGKGGTARRAALLKKIRSEEKNVLLLDAGDIFQGTPYFNFFGGELEFKLMSEMKYDAATIGNHDFDGGLDGLHKQLPHADFDFLSCNYDFSDTIMNGKTKPYKIFEFDGVKIGVLGVGIALEGLVAKEMYLGTRYLDPLERTHTYASKLKNEWACDYVICLSHLGYKYRNESDRVSDVILAEQSEYIDLIIGGHTHTFLYEPEIVKNKNGEPVIVNQVGWAGMMLGRIDLAFEYARKGKCVSCKNLVIKG